MAKRKTQKPSRPNIAFLTDELLYEYQFGIWSGVASAAEEKDVNLICAIGRSLRSPYEFESQSNIIYDLIGEENVEGVIIMGASMGARIDITEMLEFCQKYRPLPIVSIGLALEGIPSLLVDNEKGMRDVLVHFLEVHNYRRIAFIRGPAFNKEAEIRYRTYVNVLTEYGIPLETDLVIPGDFIRPTGAAAVNMLLDERRVEFDAIIAANDNMALGALDALHARGLKVPHDVALAGFDNVRETKLSTPPLTTVGQPLQEQGRKALDMLLAVMQNQEVAHEITLPTHAVIRQ